MRSETQSFWGKAQPIVPGPERHPLPLHSLDVAAVGRVLLTAERAPGRTLPGLLGLSVEEAIRYVPCLLALHDVGKFAKRFQAKAPRWFPGVFEQSPDTVPTQFDHGAGGLRLFDAKSAAFHVPPGADVRALRLLFSAVFGHHGSPPTADGPGALRGDFGTAGIVAARRFVGEVWDFFSLGEAWPHLDLERARRASFALAGLAVLADWLGSNQKWFPYSDPVEDFSAYWQTALKQAAVAVSEAGVIPSPTSARVSYADLVGTDITPSPMQAWARKVDLPDGPALFLIEDETGSGKTEAAAMLAHRLMRSGRGEGLYLALPTMATANAMFGRLAECYRALFADDTRPSIALVHGARGLHDGFQAAKQQWGRMERTYSGDKASDGADVTASAACADWVADDRRRAFLADVGAGTIDQALQAILPARHQSIRLLGLMRRVLILDEVHAYDPYMQREIERLLEFQAALGGSAIILSATLPISIRNRLAEAFAKGVGNEQGATEDGDAPADRMAYPLATACGFGGMSTTAVPGMPGRGRTLPVRFLRTPKAAIDEVESAAAAGKAVLYIRNTVDDALEAHTALRQRGLAPDIFHARFALADRLAIEHDVMSWFGKRSALDDRLVNGHGRVLIATQVVEQSLDLDFDVLVTDLAPVDLVIQRAGRLWRHKDRPGRTGEPELFVVSPEPTTNAGENWFRGTFPRAAYVYPDHARLWLTARTLDDAGGIASPGGLRHLIEAVYGPSADERVPDALQGSYWNAEGRAGAERSVANTNVLDVHTGYLRDGGAWDTDIRTPTRLNDQPQTTVRFARLRDNRVVAYASANADGASWRDWRLSEISIASHRLGTEAEYPKHDAAVLAAKADWGRFDQGKVLVILNPTGVDGAFQGKAVGGGERPTEVGLIYDQRRGLQWA